MAIANLAPSTQTSVELLDIEPFRSEGQIYARFAIEILGVAVIEEMLLLRRFDGAFFIRGGDLLTGAQTRYRRFAFFEARLGQALTHRVRGELIGQLLDEFGELQPSFEALAYSEDERLALTATDPRDLHCAIERSVRLANFRKPDRLLHERASFDIVIGHEVTLTRCRLFGHRGNFRVVTPSSDHLRKMPIRLEMSTELAVIDLALRNLEPPPPADALA